MSDNSQMIERVRKLFAKAESTTSQHEAEALFAKAYELLAKYGIEEAMARGESDESGEIVTWTFTAKGSYKLDQIHLVYGIARALHCDGLRSGDNVILYGAKRHLDRVEMLAGFLVAYLLVNLATLPTPLGVHATTYRKSAMTAFQRTVAQRLREAEASAMDEAGDRAGTELVLVSDLEKASEAMRAANPRLRAGARRTCSSVGYEAGVSHGQRVDLGGSKLAGSRLALEV